MKEKRTMAVSPRQAAPSLSIDLVQGGRYDLAAREPRAFSMIVFYRGLHCSMCKDYLKRLKSLQGEYEKRGVDILAASMDDRPSAETSVREWQLSGLQLGYGLSEQSARQWGLFISRAIKDEEPERFSEPGLFLVQPNGLLYYVGLTNTAYGRPRLEEMLEAVDVFLENEHPARGDATDSKSELGFRTEEGEALANAYGNF
jgi:peroxiredoxin